MIAMYYSEHPEYTTVDMTLGICNNENNIEGAC